MLGLLFYGCRYVCWLDVESMYYVVIVVVECKDWMCK